MRELRNWLDEASNRHALFLLPSGAVDAGAPTGLDRKIAYALAPYERSGQLHFGTLDGSTVANAPRVSVMKGFGAEASVNAFYTVQDAAAALAGPLEGVSHLFSCSAGDSWLASVQDSVRTLPGPLAGII